MNKSSYFKKIKNNKEGQKIKFSKKKKNQFFLNLFKKKNSIKIFNSLKKFEISKFFKKNIYISIKIFNSFKKFKFSKFKKKKKSSLNSSLGIESYDPLPYFPVVQHQVNFPPLAFIEAWNMSQTRGIHQVCLSLFNQ